jgi:hypothetical protein
MKRKVLIGLAALLAVIVLALVAAILWINSLARAGVEYGATYALGVDTKLGSADVGLLRGKVALDDLEVKNPAGFSTPHFLALKDGRVQVTLGSLMGDTVVVPRLTLTGIDVNLEKQHDKANYQAILDNLKRFEKNDQPAPKEAKPGRKFLIRELVIQDVTVHTDLVPLLGPAQRLDVKVPELVLHDVGKEENQGAAMAQVTDTVLKAVLLAALNKGAGIIPADIQKDLGGGLAQLGSLASSGVQVAGDMGKQIQNLGVQSGKVIGEAGGKVIDGAGKAAGDVGKGIEGLLKK